jgi:predicted DNA-binding protein YlxM (UPF0122 family)
MRKLDQIVNFYLDEAKKTSTSKITRNTKIKRTESQLASVEARKRKDPLYQKMKKHRELYLKYREQIYKKYGSKVRSKSRR